MTTVPYGYATGRVEPVDLMEIDNAIEVGAVSASSEDYLIANGYPKVPDMWCRAKTLVSVNGQLFESMRSPKTITPTSTVKYVGSTGFDGTSGTWTPYRNAFLNLHRMESTSSPLPTATTPVLTYGRTKISAPAIHLVNGSMTSRFTSANAPILTLSMAMSVTNLEIDFLGGKTTIGSQLSTVTGGNGNLSLSFPMNTIDPLYLVIEFTSTSTVTYIATSPSAIRRTSCGELSVAFDGNLTLIGTADIYAMDIWTDNTQVQTIVGEYSSAFGVTE